MLHPCPQRSTGMSTAIPTPRGGSILLQSAGSEFHGDSIAIVPHVLFSEPSVASCGAEGSPGFRSNTREEGGVV